MSNRRQIHPYSRNQKRWEPCSLGRQAASQGAKEPGRKTVVMSIPDQGNVNVSIKGIAGFRNRTLVIRIWEGVCW